jgi:hypothetical protein
VVAAAFSHAPRDGLELFVFAKGGDKGRCVRPRTMPNRTYVETLARSDFGFAPGGTGPYTYRLMETLAAGAVPVVTLDMLLPFEGVLDEWERCVIRVSYAELRELRATLLLIAPPGSDAFRARLAACRALWEAHFVGGEPARRSADAYRNSTARTFWAELRARVDAAARSPVPNRTRSRGGSDAERRHRRRLGDTRRACMHSDLGTSCTSARLSNTEKVPCHFRRQAEGRISRGRSDRCESRAARRARRTDGQP